jgi:hypothetical protein
MGERGGPVGVPDEPRGQQPPRSLMNEASRTGVGLLEDPPMQIKSPPAVLRPPPAIAKPGDRTGGGTASRESRAANSLHKPAECPKTG